MSTFYSDTSNDVCAISLRDLCQTVSVSRSFVYKEIAAGNLKKTKVGRKTLFLKIDVMDWLRNKDEPKPDVRNTSKQPKTCRHKTGAPDGAPSI